MNRTRTDQLDAHFAKWRTAASIPEDRFHEDGIIDEDRWNQAKVRVCFLMKEPNNPPKDGIYSRWDFRDEWKKDIRYTFARRLALWAAGIQHGFPPKETLHWQHTNAALRASALVNVKKTGGHGSSDVFELLTYAQRDKELVLEQLRIIDPQVIVLGLSDPPILKNALFPNLEWRRTGYDIPVALWEGRRLIDFYHPSSHNAPSASYCLLEKIMEGEVFLGLIGSEKGKRKGKKKGLRHKAQL